MHAGSAVPILVPPRMAATMRPIARMRLHLWVRPQLPGQRPRIQLLQNWFPFRVGGCLLVTAPGRLIVQVGGLTLPFVPRLALGLPLALGLVLALLRWCVVHGCPG